MNANKWPKVFPPLTLDQQRISDEFMQLWHEVLAGNARYGLIEKFNHGYPITHAPTNFLHTLEIGAGLGEHIQYENLTDSQKENYVALELRENMADAIRLRYPKIQTVVGNCQERLPFEDGYFERILAIHVLEHLPNLPAAIKEMYRLCDKQNGYFSVVIPCEGGWMYSLARRISAQRVFEKKYKQPYKWLIEREHINQPHEIITELERYFYITHDSYFPFYIPSINLNLCLGLTLRPKN
ncbi:MAG: class I SAM-dependent methyltransferase [Gammaproteobacteria bacterium]|nr:class I SAM-dependent methyltransferase [Gammaproteobacteria bacterium]